MLTWEEVCELYRGINTRLPGPAVIKASEKDDERFPHKCPSCQGPAYVGFSSIECKRGCR